MVLEVFALIILIVIAVGLFKSGGITVNIILKQEQPEYHPLTEDEEKALEEVKASMQDVVAAFNDIMIGGDDNGTK